MYFHIDESGHTGNNLFDSAQPKLAYGVLSSLTNVDARGAALHAKMLDVLGVEELHASDLGVGKLTQIAPYLIALQKKMKFDFDIYEITKIDYALVILFEAIFDAGLNPAVKWETYWTPMRYLAIGQLSTLFDEDLLKDLAQEIQSKNYISLFNHIDVKLESDDYYFDIKKKYPIIGNEIIKEAKRRDKSDNENKSLILEKVSNDFFAVCSNTSNDAWCEVTKH